MLAFAGSLALGVGGVFAQDQEEFQLPSKILPVDIFVCNYNDGQGPADLDKAAASWSTYMDQNNIDNYAAWTLTKYYNGPDQDFDFIWLGAWTDGNAMGSGTDMWLSTGSRHAANFAKVSDCAVHVNSASVNYKLPDGGTPENGVLTFSNCTINDDGNYPAISRATAEWVDILTDAGSQSAIYHWFPVFGGGGESPDFTVVTAYPNYTELGADWERRTNGELFRDSNRLFGELMDCDVPRAYNTQVRRAAQLR